MKLQRDLTQHLLEIQKTGKCGIIGIHMCARFILYSIVIIVYSFC